MPEYLKIGQIINFIGLKGELKVLSLTDYKERFEEIENLYIEGFENELFEIEKIRYKADLVVLKLKNFDSIESVEKLKNKFILIDKKNKRKLSKGQYYIYDLIGIKVYSTEDDYIGELINVLQNTAQDLYEIKLENGKTVFVPAVEAFIKDINIETGRMKIKIIEGLI